MEHLYLIAYDICDNKRWRKVFKTMKGYGQWVQLSVFQCRLNKVRYLRMEDALKNIVDHGEDHVIIVDVGPAHIIKPKIRSIGKAFTPIENRSVIV